MEFIECNTCKALPGTPELCAGCYTNRRTISILQSKIEHLESTLKVISVVIQLASKNKA